MIERIARLNEAAKSRDLTREEAAELLNYMFSPILGTIEPKALRAALRQTSAGTRLQPIADRNVPPQPQAPIEVAK